MHHRFSAVAASFLLTVASSGAVAQVLPGGAGTVTATSDGGKAAPWRGSYVTYGHTFSALTLRKDAEPLYNPYYVHRLELGPQWNFGERFFARARFELAQELTVADNTTYRHEVVVGDLPVEAGWTGWQDPWAGIRVSGLLRLTLPLSKVAHAQTRLLSVTPGLMLSRRFPVLSGLVVGYLAQYSQHFHRYTTTQLDGPTITACADLRDISCAELLHTGTRNVRNDVLHGGTVTFLPHQKVMVSTLFLMSHGFLYPLTSVPEQYRSSGQLNEGADVSVRHTNIFVASAAWQVLPQLRPSLGVVTAAAQLGPDGLRRSPFVNRFTTLFVDLSVDLEALLPKP